MKEVGTRLKTLREGIGFSQVKIGELIELKQSSINRYENGQAEAPYRVLLWYADYFDISLDYIFGRTDEPQGKLYECKSEAIKEKARKNEEIRDFVDMCFNPDSAIHPKLKQTLFEMLSKDGDK